MTKHTNPDIFEPIAVPDRIKPYVRRALVADINEPIDMTVDIFATGYHYLNWNWRGHWQGVVNGETAFDSEIDGPLSLSGQIKQDIVTTRTRRDIGQIVLEFTATGHFQLLGIKGMQSARAPHVLNPALAPYFQSVFEAEDLTITARMTLLADVLSALPKHPVPEKIAAAIERIEAADGNIRIKELLSELGLPERRFRTDFEKLIGLAPKAFCKTLQINRALNQLLMNNGGDLAGIADQSGFSDQAHFTRAFSDFLGKAPLTFLEDVEATLARFLGKSRQ